MLDIESVVDKINIPPNIKRETLLQTDNLLNGEYSKENMINNLSYSLKIKPLTYVDERKFYTYIDGAYFIYEQMIAQVDDNKKKLYSKSYAWCVANIAMYNWLLNDMFGNTLSARDVERAVDAAIREPSLFIMKTVLYGTIKLLLVFVASHYALQQYESYSYVFFLASMLINLIKVSIRIYKRDPEALIPVKPMG